MALGFQDIQFGWSRRNQSNVNLNVYKYLKAEMIEDGLSWMQHANPERCGFKKYSQKPTAPTSFILIRNTLFSSLREKFKCREPRMKQHIGLNSLKGGHAASFILNCKPSYKDTKGKKTHAAVLPSTSSTATSLI